MCFLQLKMDRVHDFTCLLNFKYDGIKMVSTNAKY
jgi:hypothetical protein